MGREKPITDEIAGAEKDIFGDYLGSTLRNPDKTLRSQGKGLQLYEDLLRDPQVRACLQSRRLAVVGRQWEVLPASDRAEDVRVAEFVRQALRSFDFDEARYVLLGGIVLGFKVSEVMWEYSEGSVWVREMIGRSSRRFAFDRRRRLRLLTPKDMLRGELLPERKFVIFRYGAESGSPYGEGLGTSLYWPVWFKKNAIKFWLIFAEKFGSPTVLGKYPPGTPREQQEALLQALQAIQQETAIKIPETMKVELLEAQRRGATDTYQALCAFMNAEIAKCILGQTLTTEVPERGSYAAARTHDVVRREYVKADAELLCNQLNRQLIRWLVEFNFPEAKRFPKLRIKTEQPNLLELAHRDERLLRMGLPIPRRYFYETYGVPRPQEDEGVLGG
jgi:phage gp29-like protein